MGTGQQVQCSCSEETQPELSCDDEQGLAGDDGAGAGSRGQEPRGRELWLKDPGWREEWAGCGQDSQRDRAVQSDQQGLLTGGLGPRPGSLRVRANHGKQQSDVWALWLRIVPPAAT